MRIENQTKTKAREDSSLCPETSTKKKKRRLRIPSLEKKAKTPPRLPGVLGRRVIDKECPRYNPGEAESTRQVEDRLPAQVLDDNGSCVEEHFHF
jgi:hypothetical protein